MDDSNFDEWDTPQEFEGVKLPKWPNNAFPEQSQKYIQELSRSSETPIELAAMLFLSTVATASHKKYIVEIKKSYRETVNLWTLSVLPPASRKSSVYRKITAPIRFWEEQNKTALEPIVKTKISKNKTIEEKIKRLRQRAANTNDDSNFDEFQEQISVLERELTSMPTYPQLWTSDITSEHLGS
jgi:replicative DNA helicase